MDPITLAAIITDPDVSGGLPVWLNPLEEFRNLTAVAVIRLAGIGIGIAAVLLIIGFIFGSGLVKGASLVVAALVAVLLVLNSGKLINNIATDAPDAPDAPAAVALAQPLN